MVGGGQVALRRARTLLAAGLRVTVVAPEVLPELHRLNLSVQQRPFQKDDLRGVRLVVAATDNPTLNDEIAQLAKAAGLLVNHAGDAGRGNLRFPALAERDGVQVAVSSGRELPMLARALADRFGALLPSREQVSAWQEQRAAALALVGSERKLALTALRNDIHTKLGGTA